MKKNHIFIILGILVGLNLLAWVAVGELSGSGGLAAPNGGEPRPDESGREVTFFDVGQGDSILTIVTELTLLYSG